MIIRKATLEDSSAICEISTKDLGYECDESLVNEQLKICLDNSNDIIYVAVVDDKVVGYIHAQGYDVLYYPHMKNVLGLAVLSDYHNKGAASKLIAKVEEWARCTGACGVRLNSSMTRQEAHVFYRNRGYSKEKTQMRFMKMFDE